MADFPEPAKIIQNDMYMDDCVTGSDRIENAIILAKTMDRILKGSGFDLRKWKSNSKQVLDTMSSSEGSSVVFTDEEKTSVLGLKWLIASDQFTFVVKTPELKKGDITKRKFFSCILQLFDPSGYAAPVVARGKILMQDLWRLNVGWDEKVTREIENKWKELWKEINLLENLRINRWIGSGVDRRIELHGFSDASKLAYGAVIYVRSENSNGEVNVNLLVSKSKVAPLKQLTIPRLELAAAELLSNLFAKVRSTMEWPQIEYTLWTDSLVTLYWINKLPCNLKTFVANRVSSIQMNSEIKHWRHVGTHDNPADLVSRGASPREILENPLWLQGPNWLKSSSAAWPLNVFDKQVPSEVAEEERTHNVINLEPIFIRVRNQDEPIELMEYSNKLERIINIASYLYRFCANATERGSNRQLRREITKILPPTNEEKAKALSAIIRIEQKNYLWKEFNALKDKIEIPSGSKIESLKPILDRNEIIRVGGRLDRVRGNYEMRHPAIIPIGSRLAWLIADNSHRRTEHGAVQVMTQHIRQRYWIPRLRNELRKYLHKCVVCVRYNHRVEGQLMSELPGDRVNPGKPFLCTGIDYAGPFSMKVIDQECNEVLRQKCWVAIFVCLKTRAVHIDLVSNLSTMAFIACYERFISRRGRCERIYSDNGTAFVGAADELRKVINIWRRKRSFGSSGFKRNGMEIHGSGSTTSRWHL